MHTSPKELMPRHTFICLPQNRDNTMCVFLQSFCAQWGDWKWLSNSRGHLGKLEVWNFGRSTHILWKKEILHGVLLAGPEFVRAPRWTWKKKPDQNWSGCSCDFTSKAADTESGSYCCSGHSGGLLWSVQGSRWPCGGGRHSDRWCCRCHRSVARMSRGMVRCGTWRSGRCWSGRSHRCGFPDTQHWSMTLERDKGGSCSVRIWRTNKFKKDSELDLRQGLVTGTKAYMVMFPTVDILFYGC